MANITYGGDIIYVLDNNGNPVLDNNGQPILASDSGFGFTDFSIGIEVTGNGVVGKIYDAGPIEIGFIVKGTGNPDLPYVPPDPSLDTTYDAQQWVNGRRLLPITIGFEVTGYVLNVVNHSTPVLLGIEITGQGVVGKVYDAGPIQIGFQVTGEPIIASALSNWVWTSRIGEFNFTHDDKGMAQKFPMLWGGAIHRIERLGNSGAVVYGANGVTISIRTAGIWSNSKILNRVGILGRETVAVSQNNREHFYIDNTGLFWRLTEGSEPKPTDYRVYFSELNTNAVMSFDYEKGAIYVCDGVRGYVWTESGLGQGPANITGMGVKDGLLLLTGNGDVVTDPFNICTDIQDFGSRMDKTAHEIDLGIAVNGDIYGAFDYRWRTNQGFFTTPWTKADRNGRVFVTASGVEFRVRVKLTTWEQIRLDYGNIRVFYDESKPLGGVQ